MEASDRGGMVSDFEREVESPSTTVSGSESPIPSPLSDGAQPSFPSVAQGATSGGDGRPVSLEMNARTLTGGEETRKEEKMGTSRTEGSGGGMELALTPFTPVDLSGKRGRGRPRGSGKRQLLASLGTLLSVSLLFLFLSMFGSLFFYVWYSIWF